MKQSTFATPRECQWRCEINRFPFQPGNLRFLTILRHFSPFSFLLEVAPELQNKTIIQFWASGEHVGGSAAKPQNARKLPILKFFLVETKPQQQQSANKNTQTNRLAGLVPLLGDSQDPPNTVCCRALARPESDLWFRYCWNPSLEQK